MTCAQGLHVVTSTHITLMKACHMSRSSEGALKYAVHTQDLSTACSITAGCTTKRTQRSGPVIQSTTIPEEWSVVGQ